MIGAGISHTRIISKVNNNALIVMENTLYSNSKPIPGYFFKGGYIKTYYLRALVARATA